MSISPTIQRRISFLLICIICIILVEISYSQGLTRTERIKGRQPPGREALKCSTLIKLNKQRTAIGLRLGTPMALTIKTYNKKLWSFELTAGISGSTFSSTSVGNIFKENQPANVLNPTYISHSTSLPLMVQLKLIRHFKFVDIDHLMGFGSLGVNVTSSSIRYVYRNQGVIVSTTSVSNPGAIGYEVREHTVDILGIGPELQIGMEYYFKSILPLVAYIEGGAYYDVKNPDTRGLILIGGAGLRYYF